MRLGFLSSFDKQTGMGLQLQSVPGTVEMFALKLFQVLSKVGMSNAIPCNVWRRSYFSFYAVGITNDISMTSATHYRSKLSVLASWLVVSNFSNSSSIFELIVSLDQCLNLHLAFPIPVTRAFHGLARIPRLLQLLHSLI